MLATNIRTTHLLHIAGTLSLPICQWTLLAQSLCMQFLAVSSIGQEKADRKGCNAEYIDIPGFPVASDALGTLLTRSRSSKSSAVSRKSETACILPFCAPLIDIDGPDRRAIRVGSVARISRAFKISRLDLRMRAGRPVLFYGRLSSCIFRPCLLLSGYTRIHAYTVLIYGVFSVG